MTTTIDVDLRGHLDRADGQEDLCFALWRPSEGRIRTTAIIHELILPMAGERHLHGNASFTSTYFLRAAAAAATAGSGLTLVHSHPRGRGWQRLSAADAAAEFGHAAQAEVITGLPLLGVTYSGGDGGCSARLWGRTDNRAYEPIWCESVRIVGERLAFSWSDQLRPPPRFRPSQLRTVSAWGEIIQANLARVRVLVVGAGSVGAIVGEALARLGIVDITVLDFDIVEEINLDRLLHADERDARRGASKVEVLASALRRASTAEDPNITAVDLSVVDPEGFAYALDADLIFSCVDRPWPRAALNFAAYAHLVPTVDGGVRLTTRRQRMYGAEWRAHLVAPGRKCMECLGQYDPALVEVERAGLLDDPSYIAGLPEDHQLRSNQNVFPFALAAASAEVLQMLAAIVAPSGVSDIGAHLYHFTTGGLDRDDRGCQPACPYSTYLLASGAKSGLTVTRVPRAVTVWPDGYPGRARDNY